jgi:hypothetical protein
MVSEIISPNIDDMMLHVLSKHDIRESFGQIVHPLLRIPDPIPLKQWHGEKHRDVPVLSTHQRAPYVVNTNHVLDRKEKKEDRTPTKTKKMKVLKK